MATNGRDPYETVKEQMKLALTDLMILCGDAAGSGATWQDVAGTAALNLRSLANMLDSLRKNETHLNGRFRWADGPIVFPSPAEVLEEI